MRRRLVRQRTDTDCGIACLAMLLGVAYEAVRREADAVAPTLMADGAYSREVQALAHRYGVELFLRRRPRGTTALAGWIDPATDVGILRVIRNRAAHFVFLWRGQITDPETGDTLEAMTYCLRYAAVPTSLLSPETRAAWR